MPGDVWVFPDGRASERGPSGPSIRPEERTASGDLFVVVGTSMYVLFRAGDYIPPSLWDYPTVPAVRVNGVLEPSE